VQSIVLAKLLRISQKRRGKGGNALTKDSAHNQCDQKIEKSYPIIGKVAKTVAQTKMPKFLHQTSFGTLK
jgi:hypothetical protein